MLQVSVISFFVLSIFQAWGHSSTFLVPALYSYGSCDTVPYPQTIRIFATTQLQESRSHVLLAATGNSTSHVLWLLDRNNLIDGVFEHPLLQLHQHATSRAFCLNYYCNGEPTWQTRETTQKPTCTKRNSASGVYAYVSSDATVSFFVSNKGPDFMIMYAALPISSAQNASYYILNPTRYQDSYIQAFALRGLERNGTEVTIIPTAPIKVYQPGLLPEVVITRVAAYDEITLTVLRFETVWVEADVAGCNSYVTLTGTLVESSFEVAVFSAQALCTDKVVLPSAVNSIESASGDGKDEEDVVWPFSFILNPLHQLPPVNRWGGLYIVDLKKLLLLSEEDTKANILSFSVLSATDTQVSITCHGQNELKACDISLSLGRGKIWRYELYAKTVVRAAEALVIKGDGPIMVLHEIYSQTQSKVHHSELLQSVDWFLKKQAVPVAYSLDDRIRPQEFAISLVMPSDHMSAKAIMVWDNKEHGTPSLLGDYKLIKSYSQSVVEDYTIVHILLDKNSYNQTDYILQFAANSTDSRARFGASIFSYRGYAFSNGYVLDHNRTRRVPVHQQQYSNLLSGGSLAIGPVAGAVFLLVVITCVLLLVFCHRKGLPLLPWLPPPPIEGFEYDVFLSFADEDKEFTEKILYDPLKERGYKVLLHLTDFIAGMTIEDNIIQAVNSSRVVIYVCSKNFNSSSFCQTELKYGMQSHYGKYRGCYRRVVPVWIGGECPSQLCTFRIRPIKTPASLDSYNEVLVGKLIRALKLGKPIHSSTVKRNTEEVELI